MSTKLTAGIEKRRARILKHLKAGRTIREISDIEGLDDTNANEIREVAKQNDIKIVRKRSHTQPVGLDNESKRLRAVMYQYLRAVEDKANGDRVEVARLTGLTHREQLRAGEARTGFTHNWTLAQIQRTLASLDVSFDQFLVRVIKTQAEKLKMPLKEFLDGTV